MNENTEDKGPMDAPSYSHFHLYCLCQKYLQKNARRKSSCLDNILTFYKSYIGFQANNDSSYFLAPSAKDFSGERYSWSLQKTRTWEAWFASTNAYWMPTTCEGAAKSQIISFFPTIKKKKSIWRTWVEVLRRTLCRKYMGSLLTKNPQFDSTRSGWATSIISIWGQEATMEILKTGHPTQIIISCKHLIQLPLFIKSQSVYIYLKLYTHSSKFYVIIMWVYM